MSPRTPRKIKQEFIDLEKIVTWNFFIGYALFPGEILGRRYSNYWGWRIWKFGVIEIFFRKLNAKEVLRTQRDEEFVFPAVDGSPKISGRHYKFQEPTMRRESVVWRENISGESQGDREEFQPEESKRWRRNQQGFLGSRRSSKRISLIVIILNLEVQLHVPRKEHILFDWIFFDVTRSTNAVLDVAQEKRIYDYWDVDENRNLSTLWTNFTRFTSLSETPLKRYNEPGDDITSRSLMAWRIDKNSESSSKKKETRINEKRYCYSMQKIENLNMHAGNRCSKLTRAEVSEEKVICIGIAGERQNSV